MKTLSLVACVAVVAFEAASLTSGNPPEDWPEEAISPDQTVARAAQRQLREAGPRGLELLEGRFAGEIAAHRNSAVPDARWRRIAAALDRVGGQYDNYSSGLYWYTDLDRAKAAALAAGRPILSLRLLGRLDENLSCANSRYFRTTLYPVPAINSLLRDRFILHWESVRPVPLVTISFGDGRTLRRTITGNSIHYILDPRGQLVDALPGLYSAQVFAEELRQAADAANHAPDSAIDGYREHMSSTRTRLLREWAADMQTVRAPLARSGSPGEFDVERSTVDRTWQRIAQLHPNAALVANIQQPPVAQEFPSAQTAAPLAVSKSAVETPILRLLANLNQTIALDTVRNNYMLRTQILNFLSSSGARSLTLAAINDWVYAQVFLTPRADPWYGLAQPDVYSAIDENGEVQTTLPPGSSDLRTSPAHD